MDVEKFHERLRELYLPPENEFSLIDVPEIRFAAIDGEGPPESEACAEAVKWLFAIVHIVRPFVKERMGKNFVNPPLEVLYWADDPEDFAQGNKDKWRWRVMIVFTDMITDQHFEEAVAKVEIKRGPRPEALRLVHMHEGKSIQIMHIGDYANVANVCQKLYGDYMPAHNLKPNGYYHEIYLNDPQRTAPEKRKVVIRQPVK